MDADYFIWSHIWILVSDKWAFSIQHGYYISSQLQVLTKIKMVQILKCKIIKTKINYHISRQFYTNLPKHTKSLSKISLFAFILSIIANKTYFNIMY